MKIIKNRFICWLWGRVYRKFTWSDHSKKYGKVIMVKGWRSATVDWRYKRMSMTPCFLWFD